jgi:hypothetical protein
VDVISERFGCHSTSTSLCEFGSIVSVAIMNMTYVRRMARLLLLSFLPALFLLFLSSHHRHRIGEWVMLMLDESVLSLLIVEELSGRRYYVTFYSGMISVM